MLETQPKTIDYRSAAESAVFILTGKNKPDDSGDFDNDRTFQESKRQYALSVASVEKVLTNFDKSKLTEEAERLVFVLTGQRRLVDAAGTFDGDAKFQQIKKEYERSIMSAENILRSLQMFAL